MVVQLLGTLVESGDRFVGYYVINGLLELIRQANDVSVKHTRVLSGFHLTVGFLETFFHLMI
jgi:hypothetical protein